MSVQQLEEDLSRIHIIDIKWNVWTSEIICLLLSFLHDNVCFRDNWIFKHFKKCAWISACFPNCTPPWKCCFIEIKWYIWELHFNGEFGSFNVGLYEALMPLIVLCQCLTSRRRRSAPPLSGEAAASTHRKQHSTAVNNTNSNMSLNHQQGHCLKYICPLYVYAICLTFLVIYTAVRWLFSLGVPQVQLRPCVGIRCITLNNSLLPTRVWEERIFCPSWGSGCKLWGYRGCDDAQHTQAL